MIGYNTHRMKTNIAIQLTNISKKYEIHHEKPTFVEKFAHGKNETFWALKNINLSIKKGERVGIIGPNGGGKTTLLKIIGGITTPTTGSIQTYKRVVSLIDLDAGFHPDLTGIQNIYLNGMLLGMSKRHIKNYLQRIISYANIGNFIDIPIHTYSLGMQLRLGFSIALHANPKIFILDEGLDVGDETFKEQIRRSSYEIFKDKTLVVVSHNMYAIADFCNRVLVMEHGTIVADGGLDIIQRYYPHVASGLRWHLKNKHTRQ